MTLPNTYDLDFSPIRQDLVLRAQQRLLKQFAGSPVINGILKALVTEVQALSDAIVDVAQFRTLPHAKGKNLDILGVLLGQSRVKYEVVAYDIVTEDRVAIVSENGIETLTADVEVPNLVVDDEFYRQFLYGKSLSNMVRYGSIPELVDLIFKVTGEVVTFRLLGPMFVEITIPGDISENNLSFITSMIPSSSVEFKHFVPFPATLNYNIVFTGATLFDEDNGFTLTDEDTSATLTK